MRQSWADLNFDINPNDFSNPYKVKNSVGILIFYNLYLFKKIKCFGRAETVVHVVSLKSLVLAAPFLLILKCPRLVVSVCGVGFLNRELRSSNRGNLLKKIALLILRSIDRKYKPRYIFQTDHDLYFYQKVMDRVFLNSIIIKGTPVSGRSHSVSSRFENQTSLRTIGFVGRLVQFKGVKDFFKIADALVDQHPEIQFKIFGGFDRASGDSVDKKWFSDAINKRPNVEYMGFVEESSEIWTQISLLCFPSYNEGFPRVIIECAGYGIPVCCYDIAANEFVVEGITGYKRPVGRWRELATTIRRLADFPAEFRKMSERTFEQSKTIISKEEFLEAHNLAYIVEDDYSNK